MHIKGHTSSRGRVARAVGRLLTTVPTVCLLVLIGGGTALADVQCAPQSLALGEGQRSFDIVAVFPDSAGPTTIDVVTSSPGLYVIGRPNPVSNVTAGGFAANWNSLITMGLAAGAADGDYVITVRGLGADETACTVDVEVDTIAADGPVVLLPAPGDDAAPDVAVGDAGSTDQPSQSTVETRDDAQPAGNPIDRMMSGLSGAGRFAVLVIAFLVVGGIVLSVGALIISALTTGDDESGAAEEPMVAPPLVRTRSGVDVDDLAAGATRHSTPLPVDEPTPLFGPRRRSDTRVSGTRRSGRQITAIPHSPPERVQEPDRYRPSRVSLMQRARSSSIGRAYLMRRVRSRVRKPSVIKRIRTAVARERAAAQAPKWDPSTRPALPQSVDSAPAAPSAETVEKTG